jgi:hypothetical protein
MHISGGWFTGGSLLLLFTLIALLVTGCNFETLEIGPLKRKTVAIQMAAADPASADPAVADSTGVDSVAAEISMGIGNLKVGGAETSLMEAIFTYNVVEWEPEVEYLVNNSIGHLTVRQPTNRNSIPTNLGDVHYEWDLRLSREVPIDLSITLGAGEGDLNLSELNLSRLEYKGGVPRGLGLAASTLISEVLPLTSWLSPWEQATRPWT